MSFSLNRSESRNCLNEFTKQCGSLAVLQCSRWRRLGFQPARDAESIARVPDIAKEAAASDTLPSATGKEPQTQQQPDLQIEVDRLRLELEHRSHLVHSLQSFLERISSTDPEDTYQAILTHSSELLQAERASLMVYDEGSNEILLKASIGLSEEGSSADPTRLGEGVAGQTLKSGQPLVIENLEAAGLTPSAANRAYKTKSFISYPIIVRGRRIGLLNFTDKTNGGNFNDVDLSLLEIIGPQIAVALERADWQERATQFQLMSITDPLTGLLNRRYLEERLTEELNRSSRYNYPMSCLMIDIDDFKKYNDQQRPSSGRCRPEDHGTQSQGRATLGGCCLSLRR